MRQILCVDWLGDMEADLPVDITLSNETLSDVYCVHLVNYVNHEY